MNLALMFPAPVEANSFEWPALIIANGTSQMKFAKLTTTKTELMDTIDSFKCRIFDRIFKASETVLHRFVANLPDVRGSSLDLLVDTCLSSEHETQQFTSTPDKIRVAPLKPYSFCKVLDNRGIIICPPAILPKYIEVTIPGISGKLRGNAVNVKIVIIPSNGPVI